MEKSELIRYKISSVLEVIVRVIAGMVLGYLTISCIFTTVYISEYENIYFCEDNPYINIAVIALVIIISAIIFGLAKRKPEFATNNKRINTFVLGVYFLLLLYIVISTMLSPTFDQYKVVNIASEMCKQNYMNFIKGGYAYKYKNQWGIILFFYGFMKLFGENNILILQIVNVLAMVGFVFVFAKVCKKLFGGSCELPISVVSCLLLPTWFYSTFIYGTYLSMCFAVMSFYFALLNMDEEKTNVRSVVFGVLSGICMSMSYQFKSNSLIFFAALIVYLAVRIIRSGKVTKLLVIVWLVLSLMLGGNIVSNAITSITGVETGKGLPFSVYFAMGAQENPAKTSGWYNGFNDQTFEACGYDYEETDRISKAALDQSLSEFKSNPKSAVGFFSRKIISQWIEPTFGSVYILLNRNSLYNPGWLKKVMDNKMGSKGFLAICNYIQTALYFGAFVGVVGGIRRKGHFRNDLSEDCNAKETKYTITQENKCNMEAGFDELLPMIAILGGFFFHIIWEAKSQYILPYYVLLVPYAYAGYKLCAQKVNNAYKNKNLGICIPVAVFTAVILTCGVIPSDSNIGLLFKPGRSTEEYYRMRQDNKAQEYSGILKDGLYTITNCNGDYLCIGDDGIYNENGNGLQAAGTKLKCAGGIEINKTNAIRMIYSDKGYVLRFQTTQYVADVENGSTEAGARLQQWDYNGDPSQTFRIEKCEDESFVIRYLDNLAFTCDENGNVYVDEISADNVYQKWYICEL